MKRREREEMKAVNKRDLGKNHVSDHASGPELLEGRLLGRRETFDKHTPIACSGGFKKKKIEQEKVGGKEADGANQTRIRQATTSLG